MGIKSTHHKYGTMIDPLSRLKECSTVEYWKEDEE